MAETRDHHPGRPNSPRWSRRFPPQVLREYSLLADGERGLLVGPRGDFAWMCAPRWDSPAIFSSLIGGGGLYAVCPEDERFVWGGHYSCGSLVWNSRWVTSAGVTECMEALAMPADADTAVVLRRIRAVQGRSSVRVVPDPRADFGRHGMTEMRREGSLWSARCGEHHLRWQGPPRIRRDSSGALVGLVRLEAGAHCDTVLEISYSPLQSPPPDPATAWSKTQAAWQQAVPDFSNTIAARDARHAYTVLRGLTSAGGGMVAAATMSLPERAEQGRNYDYRYAWIRDQCYAGQAAAASQPLPLLDEAVAFISNRIMADGPGLKPAYRADGGPVPDEVRLTHLRGYPGGADKVGNWVNRQFQLDSLGEALLLLAVAGRHDHLASEHWRTVETAVWSIDKRWRDPDAGIWELDDQHWAHSRLTCVAGLKAISHLASPADGASWNALADSILADVSQDCLHASGRWQRAPGDARVDSALLLPAIRGALEPDDPRSTATLEAVTRDLSSDGFVYRFRQDQRPLGEAEGAFLLCGFVMALAEHQTGNAVGARSWFERTRSACGPPGLLTEEFSVSQRQLRGNIPQAFVHAMLLETADRLREH